MAYSSPATVVTGTTITSTWGNSVKTAADYLANPPACKLTGAVNSVVSGTVTVLTWPTESYDTNTMHDTVTNTSRITFNTAGLYIITAVVVWPTNGTGYRWQEILLNGGTGVGQESRTSTTVTDNLGLSLTAHHKAAVNDYVEVQVRQTTGGNLAPVTPSFFAAVWVGLG